MNVHQNIGCTVKGCMHYKSGDMCNLTSIQVLPCDDRNSKGHESMCFSYQKK